MPMASFYTPWKHKKTFGFLMFLGGIERDQWHENGLMYVWYFHIIIGSKLVKTRWLRSGKLPPCHQITLNAKETTIDMPVSPSAFNSQLRWNQPPLFDQSQSGSAPLITPWPALVVLLHKKVWIYYIIFLIKNISPYSVRMWENTDHKNSEHGHFSRSVGFVIP